jgi:beta-glucosidase
VTADSSTAISEHTIALLVAQLTLEEKVKVLSGASAWSTAALPSIGLREMVMSDGPSGVRGANWDEREPSLCLPSGTSLSATWDTSIARQYGAVVAAEARRKGVDVVLGPTVNLHRSPLGGRHFEAFSEDPILTADLAAAYVRGVQENGVAATVKHYIANDFETDRFNADVRVADRPLRELYLRAFEKSVTEARAWLVMSAYNSINGTTATENELLTDPLRASWEFDGVIVSDWTAVRSLESARHPQDVAMPGPEGPWGDNLIAAVRSADIDESVIDEKVTHILKLAARVGALEGSAPRIVVTDEDPIAFARRAAAAGSVLLSNDGLLPLATASVSRIAVIGENAARPRIQGGGSATVIPEHSISPLDGIRAAFPDAFIDYQHGARVREGFFEFEPAKMANPVSGGPGAHVTYLAADGSELLSEDRFASFILDYGREEIDRVRSSMTFSTLYTPDSTGEIRLGFTGPGSGRLFVDGELTLEATVVEEIDQVQGFFSPPYVTESVEVTAGVPLSLRYEFAPGGIVDGVPDSLAVTFGETTDHTKTDDDELIREAVAAASVADVAIVVVGSTPTSESEGYDRVDLRLPGTQDALVSAVAAVNERTIVIVNAGAPVEMPWREEVSAVLLTWFGGQEYGHAVADMIGGVVEPGGRLPTTWPVRLADAPVINVTPQDGVVSYDEGIHIGYRAWLKTAVSPAYAFGHGLGYTQWELGKTELVAADSDILVEVDVTNVGDREGKHVVQLYARIEHSEVERPVLWLVGFAVVHAQAGETVRARITAAKSSLAYWNGGWTLESGVYELFVGPSVDQLADPVLLTI